MIKKLYLNKKLPFPMISLVLMLTCTLVSLSAYKFSSMDAVFNAFEPIAYWWQRFTTLFSHGNIWGVPLKIHFTGNMIGILIFSIYCEKMLPKKHFFIFFIVSLFASTVFAYVFNITGNGISSVVWSFIPPVSYAVFLTLKNYRKQSDFFANLIIVVMVIWGLVIYPMVYGNSNYHNFGVLIGLIFTVIYRKTIAKQIQHIFLKKAMPTNAFKLRRSVWILPIFILGIMALTQCGIIDTVKIVRQNPENHHSINEIIKAGNKIEIQLDRAMDTSADLLLVSSEFDLGTTLIYVDDHTAQICFSKNLEGSGYIQIRGDLFSTDGKRYPLKLDFKEEF